MKRQFIVTVESNQRFSTRETAYQLEGLLNRYRRSIGLSAGSVISVKQRYRRRVEAPAAQPAEQPRIRLVK